MDGIQNAVITSANLSTEDYDSLVPWIMLEYGDGSQQGFGGYKLDAEPTENGWHGGKFIRAVMDTIGVHHFSELKGRPLRVKLKDGLIQAIGHFVRPVWFYPMDQEMPKEDD